MPNAPQRMILKYRGKGRFLIRRWLKLIQEVTDNDFKYDPDDRRNVTAGDSLLTQALLAPKGPLEVKLEEKIPAT